MIYKIIFKLFIFIYSSSSLPKTASSSLCLRPAYCNAQSDTFKTPTDMQHERQQIMSVTFNGTGIPWDFNIARPAAAGLYIIYKQHIQHIKEVRAPGLHLASTIFLLNYYRYFYYYDSNFHPESRLRSGHIL